jgi:hypothetical protein
LFIGGSELESGTSLEIFELARNQIWIRLGFNDFGKSATDASLGEETAEVVG